MGQQLINEIGNKYGHLTPIEAIKDKNNKTVWLCKCDCGNTKIVRGSDLRKGKVTTCGKGCIYKKNKGQFINEVGNKYGFLTVIERADYNNKFNKVLWKCQCNCGNIIDVISTDLRAGKIKSCGCQTKKMIREAKRKLLLNKRFGKLIVIEDLNQLQNGRFLHKCKCDCGNICIINTSSLLSGNTQSCGCLKSKKEEEIATFLAKCNINYKREYTFKDLQSPNNKLFRFDFAIFSKEDLLLGLIEYHGVQHYQVIDIYGRKEAFQIRQKYDQIKENYCINNNIPLLILNKDNFNKEKIINFYEEIKNGKV